MTPFELTTRLMSIPSVTGAEREVGEYLSAHLASLGYRVERQSVEGVRFNVLAYAGEPEVVLCTHIDTVPPQLVIREDDTFLYGRGSCDAKGIIAAMLEAGDRLRKNDVTRFGYLFCVGEETGGDGAKAANKLKWNSKYVIVGEPTQNKLARAQKGTFTANLTMQGKAAHSGYPEAGVSAIENLWRLLEECQTADWGDDPVLGKGTFNIGVFNGGERANIVPGRASASVMIRTIEPCADVLGKMQKLVGNRAAMDVISAADPQVMHIVDGFETTVVSFGSDIPYIGKIGKPLLIGPGSILDAHTVDEKISKGELLAGVTLYERLVRALL